MAAYPDEAELGDDYDALMDAFEAWQADIDRQSDQPAGYADGLEPYLCESARTFLSGTGDENRAYSPLNVYMALAMLAETAEPRSDPLAARRGGHRRAARAGGRRLERELPR